VKEGFFLLIDIHVHTADYSPCSSVDLEDAVIRAKAIGLDGLCVTDHESNGIINKAKELSQKHNFLVIVGMELLTYEGDILVFGLEEVPKEKMYAKNLTTLISRNGGVSISAHPFRDNGRGMGNYIKKVEQLSGIEAFNGNTGSYQNKQAYELGQELNIPCFGGSDAHKIERIGIFATVFPDGIRDEVDLINAIKYENVFPVKFNKNKNEFEVLKK